MVKERASNVSKEVVLTYEGLKKLEEELEFLRGTKRKRSSRKNKAGSFIW
jgi:hypothetical protein